MFGTVCLILVPCVSYVLFEYVTGNLATVPGDMAVWNIAWMYVLYLAAFAVSGTSRIAVPVISAALLIISMAEAFVVEFRGRPIMLWDVMAFKTAATVAGNYAFVVSHEMKLACMAVVLMNAGLWFAPRRVRGWRQRLAAGGAVAALTGGFAALVFYFPGAGAWMGHQYVGGQ